MTQSRNEQVKWADTSKWREYSWWTNVWKKCSTSLTTRGIQIKTLWFYLNPETMTIMKKLKNNKCWWGCGDKRNPPTLWECKLVRHYKNQHGNFSTKVTNSVWPSYHPSRDNFSKALDIIVQWYVLNNVYSSIIHTN